MLLYLFILLLILVILLSLLTTRENFTLNDFYDKYSELVWVPTDFYSSTEIPASYYGAEMNDRFFIDTLDKNKKTFNLEGLSNKVIDQNKKQQILNRTNSYLLKILNSQLQNIEKYIFNMVYSKIINCDMYDSGYYRVDSLHVVYRDTKIYGVSIKITTIHSLDSSNILLTGYKLNGYVFEDKITDYIPKNLIDNNYQDYKQDKLIMKDEKFEKEYLCKYFKDLQKFRHINVDQENLINC